MATVYDRTSGECREERQYGDSGLRFAYGTRVGGWLLRRAALRPWFSTANALARRSPLSARSIPAFVAAHGVDLGEFEDRRFRSFGDFFTRAFREGARPVPVGDVLISPAESRVTCVDIDDATRVVIKGHSYGVDELLDDAETARLFVGGLCLVFRLAVQDCHRYSYVDDGVTVSSRRIAGALHTVSAASAKYRIYRENKRDWDLLRTERFGDMIQMEVGAMLVGRIRNHGKSEFSRGEEKGWFELGGSTIVLLIKKGVVTIDDDILEWSSRGIEVRARLHEQVGMLC
jgi:phosphatidylserine decarboxylase